MHRWNLYREMPQKKTLEKRIKTSKQKIERIFPDVTNISHMIYNNTRQNMNIRNGREMSVIALPVLALKNQFLTLLFII